MYSYVVCIILYGFYVLYYEMCILVLFMYKMCVHMSLHMCMYWINVCVHGRCKYVHMYIFCAINFSWGAGNVVRVCL